MYSQKRDKKLGQSVFVVNAISLRWIKLLEKLEHKNCRKDRKVIYFSPCVFGIKNQNVVR